MDSNFEVYSVMLSLLTAGMMPSAYFISFSCQSNDVWHNVCLYVSILLSQV